MMVKYEAFCVDTRQDVALIIGVRFQSRNGPSRGIRCQRVGMAEWESNSEVKGARIDLQSDI